MALSGYDLFFDPPGAVVARACALCGADCRVTRGVWGPTSSAQAAARRGEWHDRFECRHAHEPWHRQAVQLKWELDTAGGAHCREWLAAELRAVLAGRPAR